MLKVFIFLVALFALSPEAWAHRTGKPEPPIDLVLTSGEAAGGRRTVRLEARPNIQGERLTLEIKLPRGVALIHGTTRWEGVVEDQTLEVVVEGRAEKLGAISAVATIYRQGEEIVQAAKIAPIDRAQRGQRLRPMAPIGGVIESQGAR